MRIAAIGLILTMLATAAAAATLDEKNKAACVGHDSDAQIEACSALIASGALTPKDTAVSYSNRAIAYNRKNLSDQAIADTNRAIELDPDGGNAYAIRGTAYRHQGQIDQAIADYTKAATLTSNPAVQAVCYYDRGWAYDDQKNYERALADLDKSITLMPTAKSYMMRARIYHHMGRDAEGLPDAEKAISGEPNNTTIIATRANIYEALGRRDDAIAGYRAVLLASPNDPDALAGLMRLGVKP